MKGNYRLKEQKNYVSESDLAFRKALFDISICTMFWAILLVMLSSSALFCGIILDSFSVFYYSTGISGYLISIYFFFTFFRARKKFASNDLSGIDKELSRFNIYCTCIPIITILYFISLLPCIYLLMKL